MPDAPPSPAAAALLEACPHARSAARRYRAQLARGQAAAEALADMVAYLTVLRPGLPRVLAQDQAEAIAAAVGPVPSPQRPPRPLLNVLATPALPERQ